MTTTGSAAISTEARRQTRSLLFSQAWIVPRWTTTRYRAALKTLAVRELGWATLVWGPFYLLVWAFAGFRPQPVRTS